MEWKILFTMKTTTITTTKTTVMTTVVLTTMATSAGFEHQEESFVYNIQARTGEDI